MCSSAPTSSRLQPGCGEFTITITPTGEVLVDFVTEESVKVLKRFCDVEIVNNLCG